MATPKRLTDHLLGDGMSSDTGDGRHQCAGTGGLMLTSFADDEALSQAIVTGATGDVHKQIRSGELVGAVRRSRAEQPRSAPRARE